MFYFLLGLLIATLSFILFIVVNIWVFIVYKWPEVITKKIIKKVDGKRGAVLLPETKEQEGLRKTFEENDKRGVETNLDELYAEDEL